MSDTVSITWPTGRIAFGGEAFADPDIRAAHVAALRGADNDATRDAALAAVFAGATLKSDTAGARDLEVGSFASLVTLAQTAGPFRSAAVAGCARLDRVELVRRLINLAAQAEAAVSEVPVVDRLGSLLKGLDDDARDRLADLIERALAPA